MLANAPDPPSPLDKANTASHLNGMSPLSSPIILLLPVLVAAVLLVGLLGFAGNTPWYQRHAHMLMQLRVGLQFLTIALLLILVGLG